MLYHTTGAPAHAPTCHVGIYLRMLQRVSKGCAWHHLRINDRMMSWAVKIRPSFFVQSMLYITENEQLRKRAAFTWNMIRQGKPLHDDMIFTHFLIVLQSQSDMITTATTIPLYVHPVHPSMHLSSLLPRIPRGCRTDVARVEPRGEEETNLKRRHSLTEGAAGWNRTEVCAIVLGA